MTLETIAKLGNSYSYSYSIRPDHARKILAVKEQFGITSTTDAIRLLTDAGYEALVKQGELEAVD